MELLIKYFKQEYKELNLTMTVTVRSWILKNSQKLMIYGCLLTLSLNILYKKWFQLKILGFLEKNSINNQI